MSHTATKFMSFRNGRTSQVVGTGQLLWSLCAMRYAKHGVSIFGIVDLLTSLELPEQLSPPSPQMHTSKLL